MSEITRVFLKPKEENEIEQGFPWVFDNEISSIKWLADDGSGMKQTELTACQVADGTPVEVYTKAGGFLGSGIINRTSKITVRMIGMEHADQIYADTASYWEKKVRDAVNIRRLHYSEQDSYRLIFGEADFIPGLIAERYCDVSGHVYIVIQFLSLSCDIFRSEIIAA